MIGTLRETDLHAALKQHYARPGDRLETAIDGYVIDIVREDELIEIQTHNFAVLKRKLSRLLEQHRVRLVYPIAQARWITRMQADRQTVIRRRKSPKSGIVEDLFMELVSLPELLAQPNFTLEVVLIHEEELCCPRESRRRVRGRREHEWQVYNRKLLKVIDQITFETPADFLRFIPAELPRPFTSHDLAAAIHRPDYVAHKMTYCLRKLGVLTVVGKQQRAWLYMVATN